MKKNILKLITLSSYLGLLISLSPLISYDMNAIYLKDGDEINSNLFIYDGSINLCNTHMDTLNPQTKPIVKTGWVQDTLTNTWMYCDNNGNKISGWIKDNDKWYYLNSDGIMQTGWLLDRDSLMWYYLNSDGTMAYDTTIDGYMLNSNGAWILNASGAMSR